MKKLFTLITLFAMAMAVNAQLHFVYNNENVANGATIVSDKVHMESLIPGVLELYHFKPDVFLKSEKAGNITVTGEFVDEAYSICWGSQCKSLDPANLTQYVNGTLEAGSNIDLQIHSVDVQSRDALKTTTVKVSAQYDGDASSKITATFILSLDPSLGVNEIQASDDANAPVKEYNVGGRTASGKGLSIIKRGKSVKKIIK